MKFGVREICDVVLKAKANQKIGNKIFYKNEPVIYFDTLKTSSMEGAATTVYAQGGRGNSRLMAWEGERTVTFTMEDALISPAGFMILSGAGLIEASDEVDADGKYTNSVKVHTTEQTNKTRWAKDEDEDVLVIELEDEPYMGDGSEDYVYVMLLDDKGEIDTEPYIPEHIEAIKNANGRYEITVKSHGSYGHDLVASNYGAHPIVLVDYYVERTSGVSEITITPDKFGGYYYLEASTLFRNTDGVDMPAEFVIPNCKIQSNFTFTMASSGDPSTFTFTIDAFPDYTRFNPNKKVLAAIQVVTEAEGTQNVSRIKTHSEDEEDTNGMIVRPIKPQAEG